MLDFLKDHFSIMLAASIGVAFGAAATADWRAPSNWRPANVTFEEIRGVSELIMTDLGPNVVLMKRAEGYAVCRIATEGASSRCWEIAP